MKKILIATALTGFNDEFWSPVVEKKLLEYGFEIEHFFKQGLTLADLPVDPDVEAVVTSWGSPCFTAEVFEKLPPNMVLNINFSMPQSSFMKLSGVMLCSFTNLNFLLSNIDGVSVP